MTEKKWMMNDREKKHFTGSEKQHMKLAEGRKMTISLITDFVVILQKKTYCIFLCILETLWNKKKKKYICVLVFEIRPIVTPVHSCKPCTKVQWERSKRFSSNQLCYALRVPSTPSFSSFVLTSTTAIADADTWLVKACCALLNHRLHKNVKGIIQLLGVIKYTSPADRPRENTQTSHRKISEQKWSW